LEISHPVSTHKGTWSDCSNEGVY